jgi:acyl-CoA reductase-like NAD-dependent aldehyde dehydrogenase
MERGDLLDAAHLSLGEETARWVLYELQYVRREAQAEADLAYEAWSQLPGRDGYAVYRAAQDRADAAQDELAAWVRGSQVNRPSARAGR